MSYWDGVAGGRYYLITGVEEVKRVLDEAWTQEAVALDTETSSKLWWQAELAGWSISWGQESWYVPTNLETDSLLAEWVGLYTGVLCFWNAKYDLHILARNLGAHLHPTARVLDGVILSKLVDENGMHGLKHVACNLISPHADKWEREVDAWRTTEAKRRRAVLGEGAKLLMANYLDCPDLQAEARKQAEAEGLKTWKPRLNALAKAAAAQSICEMEPHMAKTKKEDITYADVPVEIMAPYAAADTHYTFICCKELLRRLPPGGRELLGCEMALTKVLFDSEHRGMPLDDKFLSGLRPGALERLADAERRAWAAAGREFNLRSWQQLLQVLLDMDVPLTEIGKTDRKKIAQGLLTEEQANFSTSSDDLKPFADDYPIVQAVLDHRRDAKLVGTYIDGLLEAQDSAGRVRSSYNQIGAKTGRFSSSGPNMQNIDPRVKGAFVVPDGYIFLSLDYSQVELRLLAHGSQDPALMDCYPWEGAGVDVHTKTAAEAVAGVTVAEYKALPEEEQAFYRKVAKGINFGIAYGAGASTLHRALRGTNTTLEFCQAAIDKFFEVYSEVRRYQQDNVDFLHKNGFVASIYGRRRNLPEAPALVRRLRKTKKYTEEWKNVNSKLGRLERQANNFIIQSPAADIFKRAVVRLAAFLQGRKTYMANYVHDDIQFFMHRDELDLLQPIIDIMMDFPEITVPLATDPEVSVLSWADKVALDGRAIDVVVRELDEEQRNE